ncbi:hypothetical protein D0T84_07450 [Dysgonomonas sp. 521]|nr:hypothetical protein [Dysgonomonas sp. 521]
MLVSFFISLSAYFFQFSEICRNTHFYHHSSISAIHYSCIPLWEWLYIDVWKKKNDLAMNGGFAFSKNDFDKSVEQQNNETVNQ